MAVFLIPDFSICPFMVLISGEFSQNCHFNTDSKESDLQRLCPNLFSDHIQYLINVVLKMIPNSLMRAALCTDEENVIQSTKHSSVNKSDIYFDTPLYFSLLPSISILTWLIAAVQAQEGVSLIA